MDKPESISKSSFASILTGYFYSFCVGGKKTTWYIGMEVKEKVMKIPW